VMSTRKRTIRVEIIAKRKESRFITTRETIDFLRVDLENKYFKSPVKRPFYSLLNKNKIKQTFELDNRHWEVSLSAMLCK